LKPNKSDGEDVVIKRRRGGRERGKERERERERICDIGRGIKSDSNSDGERKIRRRRIKENEGDGEEAKPWSRSKVLFTFRGHKGKTKGRERFTRDE